MSSPRLSVVIPTYNRRPLLADAVSSCLSQTFQDLEVLIIDDGSTDDTREWVAQLLTGAGRDGRVHYFRQNNRGASSARNAGLQRARGEFIQFLDSDDRLLPTKFDRQLAVLDTPEWALAPCCHCLGVITARFDGNGYSRSIGVRTTDVRLLLREMCSRQVHVLPTLAPLWRSAKLKQSAGWREDIALGDDLEFHARLLACDRTVGFVDAVLFEVRDHPGDRLSVHGPSPASVMSALRTRRSLRDSVGRAGLWDRDTQRVFVRSMRTIYANALETSDAASIRDVEGWIEELASAPANLMATKALLAARRLLGRRALLAGHNLLRNLGNSWRFRSS